MTTTALELGASGQARPAPLTRLYRGQTRFDFVRRRRWWFAASSLVILAGLISLGVKGLNYSSSSWAAPRGPSRPRA